MKKRYILVALMLGALAFSYFYEPSLDSLPVPRGSEESSQALDFYIRDLETRSFNTDGTHTNTLSSILATQQDGQKEILLEQPVMLIALHLAPWTAHAEKGTSSADQKKISLQNDVLLSRTDGVADVKTGILVFDSQAERAYTESPVEILARGSRTTADGVSIDLNREIIHLNNNVRTYYVPEAARTPNAPSLY